MKLYLSQQGIVHHLICPYTSAQNGLVERKHRQIIEAGLSMLAHVSMPLTYWNDVFATVVYLLNRLPSQPLNNISSYEKLFKVLPSYAFLHVFGCLCFPNLRPYNTHKLQYRSTPCTFLGYSSLHKGYRCQDSFGRMYVICHVTFHETIFPFKAVSSKPPCSSSPSLSSSKLLILSTADTKANPSIQPPQQLTPMSVASLPNSP